MIVKDGENFGANLLLGIFRMTMTNAGDREVAQGVAELGRNPSSPPTSA
jgi:hypothetical protein